MPASAAGYLNDLRVLNPPSGAWRYLSGLLVGAPPSRQLPGFASGGGRLYLYGGVDGNGSEAPAPSTPLPVARPRSHLAMPPPPPRAETRSQRDSASQRVVLGSQDRSARVVCAGFCHAKKDPESGAEAL